jgi:8-oxo-dGTP pyrophosphatase MutT (NUDIX family)
MKVRQQSGCVVFRESKRGMEFLLVRSSRGGKWVFAKGGVEPDLTSKKSALKELYEEAGVTGKIIDKLGVYKYKKLGRPQVVTLYSCVYTKDTKDWPERKLRKRKWFSYKDALKALPKYLQPFLSKAHRKSYVATAANVDLLPHVEEHPVLSDVNIDRIGNIYTLTVGDLYLRIRRNFIHPMQSQIIIEYEFVRDNEDFGGAIRTTEHGLVNRVAHIVSQYKSGTLGIHHHRRLP